MKTLDRKLLRDLSALRGQGAAIGVVIAAGVMTLIIAVTTVDAISLSRDRFYDDYRFADVFADLKRAPEPVAERLRTLPGVDRLETRVRAPVRLTVPDYADPVQGLLISIPDGRQPDLNRLHLRSGSLPEPGRSNRVVVSEPFAEAHGLRPGDKLTAVINGGLEDLVVSGVALSPEYVYQVGPNELMPDYERFGVLWMNRETLAAAFDMEGAFNNVVLSLQAGASGESAVEAVDAVLARHGGIGAYVRDDQISHRILSQEIDQLRVTATVLPAIFLGVAAFLLNVLMGRIVRTQRQQIAILKAFGYSNVDIVRHYGLLTGLIVLAGVVLGVAFGAWAADGLAAVYAEYFRFPEMSFRLRPGAILLGAAVAAGAAMLGTGRAVYGAVRLPPAEAMRPPAPERFRTSRLEYGFIGRLLDQPSRIVLRNLSRHPVKTSLSILGIGLSAALLLLGGYQFGAIDHLIDVQYRLVLRMDADVAFTEPASESAAAGLRHVPGVRYVETYRGVPVRLINGTRDYRTAILGTDPAPRLRGLIDADYRPIELPGEGLLLTSYLAEDLGVSPGDTLQVEVLEGHRRMLDVPLAGVVDEPVGVSAYMDRRALNRLMREGPAVSGAWLLVDRSRRRALYDRLSEMPRVAGIGLISESERNFRDYIEDTALVIMGIMLLLAASIAFAVVYNSARIAYAERERELATLRVLGFTRAEVAWILVGEIAVPLLLAIPLGWLLGTGFVLLLNQALSMDLFRIPLIITPRIYAFAAAGVLAAAALSMPAVIGRLRRLDMVSALKTIE